MEVVCDGCFGLSRRRAGDSYECGRHATNGDHCVQEHQVMRTSRCCATALELLNSSSVTLFCFVVFEGYQKERNDHRPYAIESGRLASKRINECWDG